MGEGRIRTRRPGTKNVYNIKQKEITENAKTRIIIRTAEQEEEEEIEEEQSKKKTDYSE
jgi:hypothetical protein